VWRLAVATGRQKAGHVFVPAFSPARVVVENLGVRLTQKQPILEPAAGPSASSRGRSAGSPGLFSPVVLGRREARLLAGFVHLGLSVREGRREEGVYDEFETLGEELVYIPALPDPRCVHDAGWRLLLREFDE
jgi:hypothetical protein